MVLAIWLPVGFALNANNRESAAQLSHSAHCHSRPDTPERMCWNLIRTGNRYTDAFHYGAGFISGFDRHSHAHKIWYLTQNQRELLANFAGSVLVITASSFSPHVPQKTNAFDLFTFSSACFSLYEIH